MTQKEKQVVGSVLYVVEAESSKASVDKDLKQSDRLPDEAELIFSRNEVKTCEKSKG